MNDELKVAIDEYYQLLESDENKRRRSLWQTETMTSMDKFRRIPKPLLEVGIPIIVDTAASIWRSVFNFNMRDYYTEPNSFLLNYLKAAIAHFDLGDDTHLSNVIGHWAGVGLESSVFGMDTIYHDVEEPSVGRNYPLKERDDLEKLDYPDFFTSGMMPLLHRFYTEVNEMLDGTGLRMDFANYIRAPYGVAFQIREFTNLAIDTIDDPEWVQQLMRFLTDCHKKWYEDRSEYLEEPIHEALLFNDEIDFNIIPPYYYEQFIYPYESELADFHGGVAYWHSCGKITPAIDKIRQLRKVRMIKIGSWNDYRQAAKICPDIPLEFCINAIDYVQMADRDKMTSKITEIIDICREENVESFIIRTEPLQKFSKNVRQDLEKCREWVKVARVLTQSLV